MLLRNKPVIHIPCFSSIFLLPDCFHAGERAATVCKAHSSITNFFNMFFAGGGPAYPPRGVIPIHDIDERHALSDSSHLDKAGRMTAFIRARNLEHSMNQRSNCHDNAVLESFFSPLRRKPSRRRTYKTRQEAGQAGLDRDLSTMAPCGSWNIRLEITAAALPGLWHVVDNVASGRGIRRCARVLRSGR